MRSLAECEMVRPTTPRNLTYWDKRDEEEKQNAKARTLSNFTKINEQIEAQRLRMNGVYALVHD